MVKSSDIRRSFKGDRVIWGILLFMSILSVLAVYSSTGSLAFKEQGGDTEFFLLRRIIILAVSWLAAFIIHKIPVKYIKIFAVITLLVSIPFLILNLAIGSRWAILPLVGISIQFSEIAKFALIITTAWLLTLLKDRLGEWRTFLILILPATVVSGLIFFGDFSTAALIFFANTILLYMGRAHLKHLLVMSLIILLGLFGLYKLVNAYPEVGRFGTWQNRIDNYFNPETNSNDGNYQIKQSKIAIATGGLFGKLPGKSTQRYFLPEAHNDFIYSIIIEEYGSIVGGVLTLLYLILLYRSIAIFMKSEKIFNSLVVLGIGFTISIQAMINMAVSVGIIPVTGQTLPAISQGGSSVLMTFMAIGVIQAVTSQQNQVKTEKEEVADE
jgi:cell division protein FtsW